MAKIPAGVVNAVKKFKEAVKSRLDVKKVFIFGSYAKGNFTKDSDIDVCVIADRVENNFMAMFDIAPLSIGVDLRIESVVFSYDDYRERTSYGLLGEVKRYGVEV